ncbi:hypothetical protein C2845_PM13G15520 [Panicum miliaceum]|uniref:Uncharacterized protein n=1 Tax=Panicum miliaceum TaxID=4540 RepID=A0A3L6RI27_PANMI|nr:hypothetical protein C2845_PM13G15520 [Panicum miliaceum]
MARSTPGSRRWAYTAGGEEMPAVPTHCSAVSCSLEIVSTPFPACDTVFLKKSMARRQEEEQSRLPNPRWEPMGGTPRSGRGAFRGRGHVTSALLAARPPARCCAAAGPRPP